MNHLVPLDPATLARTLETTPKGLLVLFSTAWCGPCKTYKPILERVVDESRGDLQLLTVDTDASSEVAARYGVRSVPTLLCFAEGEFVGRQTGAMREPQLRATLRNLKLSSDLH